MQGQLTEKGSNPQTQDGPIRVLLLGAGQMGGGMASHIVDTDGLELVGVIDKRDDRIGLDVGTIIGGEKSLGLAVEGDLEAAIKRLNPDIAVQATCSRVAQAWPEISVLLKHSVSVISIAEEMSFPSYSEPEIANQMQWLAKENNARVLGTGINPGFVMDLLVLALTGACRNVQAINATRVNDLSPFGPTVLSTQGVGRTPEEFQAGMEDGSVVGHFGFPESISMVASALGIEIERIEQKVTPIITNTRRETPHIVVEPGNVAGARHEAIGYFQGKPFINFVHPQQIRPEVEGVETGDTIEIIGEPDICLATKPEIAGGIGTSSVAVNMIPRLLAAPAGLYNMAELPVPVALKGKVK